MQISVFADWMSTGQQFILQALPVQCLESISGGSNDQLLPKGISSPTVKTVLPNQ